MPTKPVKFAQTFEIPPPIVNVAIPVSDWEHLIKKIKNIHLPFPIYSNAGTLTIGAAVSLLVTPYQWISIFLFVIGALLVGFSFEKRKEVEHGKEEVLDFIDCIEKRCRERCSSP